MPLGDRGPMLKTKSSALLSLVLVFLSGTLVGAVTYRLYMVNSVNSGGAPPGRGQGKMDPEEVRKRRVAEMKGEVVSVEGDEARIRFTGRWESMKVSANETGAAVREQRELRPTYCRSGVEGIATYSVGKKELTSLLLVFRGNYRDLQHGGLGAPVHKSGGVVEWRRDPVKK